MSETPHIWTPERNRDALIERFGFKRQYETWVRALDDTGILELWTERGAENVGITDIEGTRCPLPSFEAIKEEIQKNHELLSLKCEQGFTQLEIVPITMERKILVAHTREEILAAKERGPIYSAGTKTKLDIAEDPLFFDDILIPDQHPDPTKSVVYYPYQFTQDHGGMTKPKLIQTLKATAFPGWEVLLTEPGEIPAKGAGQTRGPKSAQRMQWEADREFKKYLALLNDPQYAHEIGSTLESWLTRVTVRLRTKNEVIDDWKGIGKLCALVGNYLPSSGRVPRGIWARDYACAYVAWREPGYRSPNSGARSAVRIVKVLKFVA